MNILILNIVKVYEKISDLYAENNLDALSASQCVVEYIDTAESESALIATDIDNLKFKPYTHVEIHPSLILGVMGNQVVFPANNQLPRDLFACGKQNKQFHYIILIIKRVLIKWELF